MPFSETPTCYIGKILLSLLSKIQQIIQMDIVVIVVFKGISVVAIFISPIEVLLLLNRLGYF